MSNKLLKPVLVVCGSICVGLGFIGIFLPLLPTTPFLLLASACYVRSSPRLYHKLLNNKLFGPYIKSYQEHRAIPLHAKVAALILLWLTIGYTALFVVPSLAVKILLFGIAVGVTIFLLKVKTLHRAS
ncbi:MAG: DUF454 domain-containing protein [bacterium]|nr:DUF454 domain-containing protein [bacterium]